MTPPETSAVARELAALREDVRGLGESLGEIKTACAVLVERSDRTEADIRAHDDRISALERRVWTASGAAAGLGGMGGWLLQQIGG